MKELVVATNNAGKLREIKSLLPDWNLLTLEDIGFRGEIPEPHDTFNENARAKAQTIYEFCGKPVMADDSGLCIDALGGAPGVFSARYAGDGATDEENVQKALSVLGDGTDRKAHYTAVICLILNGATHFFEGYCHGQITSSPQGKDGFGYDPIFMPDGYDETFAELPLSIKNTLSHRGEATRQMARFFH